MDKEQKTTLVRNILWGALLVVALVYGISGNHWKPFIFLAIGFVISKTALLIGQAKLRKSVRTLETSLQQQGRPSYIPKPDQINAMNNKADAIAAEILRRCPPQPCLRFAIAHGKTPTLFDSKLGGTPYWDSSLPYPTDAKGKPMTMVMQVNFGQCPHVDPLPPTGMLQFFISADKKVLEEGYGEDYDNPTNQANFRIIYHKQLDPTATPGQSNQYPRCETLQSTPLSAEYALQATVAESSINQTCENFDTLAAAAIKKLFGDKMGTLDVADYIKQILPEDHRDDVDDALVLGDNPIYYGGAEGNFQLLGFPVFEQYDDREGDTLHDTLLLQIPTLESGSVATNNHIFHTLWGDCGSVRLFINADALRRLDFSDVRYGMQCY